MEELINWKHLKTVLEEYAVALRNQYQDNLIENDHVTLNGNLLNSVEYIVNKGGHEISVSLKLQDYWKYVEYDTKPHFPPVDKIREWIKIKPVLPYPDDNGNLPTENQLAYLIGRKISEEGTEGTHDLYDAVNFINDEYEEKIGIAIEEDISDNLNIIFSEFFRSS